jgi:hypothetical protein
MAETVTNVTAAKRTDVSTERYLFDVTAQLYRHASPVARLSFGVEAVRLIQGPSREGRPLLIGHPLGDAVNGSFIFAG